MACKRRGDGAANDSNHPMPRFDRGAPENSRECARVTGRIGRGHASDAGDPAIVLKVTHVCTGYLIIAGESPRAILEETPSCQRWM